MKAYFTLKNYTIAMALIFVAMVTINYVSKLPQTITLTSDRWKCTDTMPEGLGAQCTNLTYIPTINQKLAMKSP